MNPREMWNRLVLAVNPKEECVMRRVMLCIISLASGLVLAAMWSILALPDNVLAAPPTLQEFAVDVGRDIAVCPRQPACGTELLGCVLDDVFDVGTTEGCDEQPIAFQTLGKKSTGIVVNIPAGSPANAVLNLRFFANHFGPARGVNCFGSGVDSLPIYAGHLGIHQAKDGSAVASYYFTAKGDDGVTYVQYILEMFGTFEGDPDDMNEPDWFPFDVGDVRHVDLNSWEIGTEKKRDKRISCTGEGDAFDTVIRVERTN